MAYELIKVSELPELTTPSDPNVLPIQDGDYLKRISFENLKEAATGDVADDLAAEVTARERAVSDEATARGNADTAILADLASPYSASATYAVGDYCTKDGQLYRCTTAISTAEAWTAAHWSAVELGEDVSTLRSAISTVSDGYNPYKLIRNAYITGGGAEAYYAGWGCSDYIPIPAEGLEIYATVASTYNAFYDENKAFLTGGTFTIQVGLNRILPITNAKYIRLSNTAAGMSATKIYGQTALNTEEIENIESYLSAFPSALEGNVMPDTTEWITGRVYNGVYDSSITSIKCTDYIPVIGGEKYYIYGGYISAEYFGVYDKDKNLISGWSFTSVSTDSSNASTAVITLAQTAKYIRLNALVSAMSSFPTDAYIGLYPNFLPKKADMSDYVPRIKGNGTLSDKKILVIGDSISTDVYGRYKKWVTDLCEQGFFSKGYVTNNSYHATGYVATYKEGGVVAQDTFLNRITALGDLSGYDMIVTFGGINDWIQSVDFEEFKDAVDDYYAYLIEHATQARIAVIAPLRTSLYGTTNSEEKTQKDYSDYIKSVALDYSFPVLNLTDEGGFCPEKSTAFSNMWTLLPTGQSSHDGVHPNADWEKKYLAPQIAWFLSNLI